MKRSIDEKKLEQALRELGAAFPMRVFPMRQGEPEEKRTRLVAFTALRLTASAAAMLLLVALLFTLLPERLPQEEASSLCGGHPTGSGISITESASSPTVSSETAECTPPSNSTRVLQTQNTVPDVRTSSPSTKGTVPSTGESTASVQTTTTLYTGKPYPVFSGKTIRCASQEIDPQHKDCPSLIYNGLTQKYFCMNCMLRNISKEKDFEILHIINTKTRHGYSSFRGWESGWMIEDIAMTDYYISGYSRANPACPTRWLYKAQTGELLPVDQDFPDARSLDGRYSLIGKDNRTPGPEDDVMVLEYQELWLYDNSTGEKHNILPAGEIVGEMDSLHISPHNRFATYTTTDFHLYNIEKGTTLTLPLHPFYEGQVYFFENDRYVFIMEGSFAYKEGPSFGVFDTQTGEKVTEPLSIPDSERYLYLSDRISFDDTSLRRIDLATGEISILPTGPLDYYWVSTDFKQVFTYVLGNPFILKVDVATQLLTKIPLEPDDANKLAEYGIPYHNRPPNANGYLSAPSLLINPTAVCDRTAFDAEARRIAGGTPMLPPPPSLRYFLAN